MASLGKFGTLSFFIGSSNSEKSFNLHSSSNCRRRRSGCFPSPVCCRGNSLCPDVNVCRLRLSRVAEGDSFVGISWSGGRTGKGLRAVGGGGGGVGGEEDVGGGVDHDDGRADVDVGGDALEAAIAKSKKVLAMQKDLLQRIVERRKLVSSIKESVVDTEKGAVSYNEGDGSSSNLDLVSTSSKLDKKYRKNIFSETYAQPTAVDTIKAPPIGVSGDLIDEDKELKGTLQVENSLDEEELKKSSEAEGSVADALGLLREASSKTAQSKTMPSLLPSASETNGAKDENVEELEEENVDNVGYKQDVAPEEENVNPPPLAGANVMNVILVAAECTPWSKTGGLGDVAGALPKALARRGHRVMVVVPQYGNYSEPQEIGIRKRYKVDGQDMEVTYFHAYIDGVDFVFIDSPVFRHRENNIYGGERPDILKRMVLFCKAAVEVPWHIPCGGVCYGDGNLVFIANDWHTALLPVYLKAYYRDNGLMKYTRSILVIHNIAHQGRGPLEDFSCVDLPGHYMDLFKMYDPVGGEHFNIFAAGLKTADRVVTVSHGYAWELKTSEGGWGLHGIINENGWKLQGIVNGVDMRDWNPELDVHLNSDGYTNYSLETLQTGKPQCKEALQRELGLPVRGDIPLIGFIGRLDHQKGVDLIAEAIPWMVGQDMQLVMLGTGRRDLEEMLRKFESQHHDKVRGWVGFSVEMAHRITAGADIILMPSRFEPCGLNQLYAMIYGTIPVVHAVGGLRDTVQPFNPYQETGVGWTFERAETNRLIDALGNCFKTYKHYKKSWEGLQRRGMMQDLSWDHAAQLYEQVLVAAKYQW